MPASTCRLCGVQVEDGAVLELAIRLPPPWPLKPADVECRRKVRPDRRCGRPHTAPCIAAVSCSGNRSMPLLSPRSQGTPNVRGGVSYCSFLHGQVGVSEGRLRKWLLSISAFLRNQNGSILDAMSLWKANVDQTFQVSRKQSWRNRHTN